MTNNVFIRDFVADLAKLEKKVINKAIKASQKEALKPLVQKVKSDAPVDTGELRQSIKSKVGPRRKGFIITVVNISTADENAHVGYQEFGTREYTARPFIRPAAKELKPEIVDRFLKALDDQLKNLGN